MPIERKLAAIMFTDIAGYTALSAKDSTKASELLKTQRDTLKPIVEKHGGSWMKEMGDGLLLTFDSATSAVECSIAIQEAAKDIEDLNLRIGIHEGEVIKQDGDVIGDDVNVASRIEPYSAVGGVAISDKIYRAISSNTEFETKYIGKPKLKGVSQKVEVYCITSHDLPETDVSKVSAKLEKEEVKPRFNIFALTGGILTAIGVAFWIAVGVFDISFGGKTEVPSIAIIPFDNKGAKEDEFYAYSISSELISDVTNAGLIRVAGLKDIESLEYQTMKYDELSEKLLVRYIAHGSIWKIDSIFQLSMELYDTKTSRILWSENWKKGWNEITSIKGNLAENILKTLKVSTKQDITKAPTSNTEAYEYYLRAKYIDDKREDMNDTEIARGLYRKAIELDDNLILAKHLLGSTYIHTGDYDKAMAICTLALKQAEELGDKLGIGRNLTSIGIVYKIKGDLEKALEYYKQSLIIREEIEDILGIASNLNNIASVYYTQGNPEKALEYYKKSLAISEEIGSKMGIVVTLRNIGLAHSNKGDIDTALDHYKRSLKIAEEIGSKREIGINLISIGNVSRRKGDYDKGLEYFERSLVIMEKIGDKSNMGYVLHTIGIVHRNKGDYDKALDYYGRSLAIREELGDKHGMGYSLLGIGIVHRNKGDYGKALDYLDRALKIEEELGNKRRMRGRLASIGWIYYIIGEYNKALEYHNRELVLAKELKDNKSISNIFNNKGLISFNNQDFTQALENLEISVTMQMEIDSTITLETLSHLFLSKKILGKEYNVKEIHTLIKEQEEIDDYINFALFKLLEDKSHLETAYNQVKEKASAMEEELVKKFLSYPIPKAIVEEWEKVK